MASFCNVFLQKDVQDRNLLMKNIFHYIFSLIVESALTQIYVNVLQNQAGETPLVVFLITVLWFPF